MIAATMQTPINVPRMVSPQIRAQGGTIIQQQISPANVQIQSHPPALHPVSQNTFAPGGAQVSVLHPIWFHWTDFLINLLFRTI